MKTTTRVLVAAAAAAVVLVPGARQSVMSTFQPVVTEFSNELAYVRGADGAAPTAASSASPAAPQVKAAAPKAAPAPKAAKAPAPAKTSPVGSLGFHDGASHYAFTARGQNGQPARWNPCAPVKLVINPSGAPAGAVADMRTAVDKVRSATGLDLRVVGTTSAKSVPEWGYHQRAGWAGWAPVLISWGHPGGALNPGASATTEPVWQDNANGQAVFVSGQLRVNVEHDDFYTPGFGTETSRVALYMHELGHVVGLEHVKDAHQLMYPSMGGTKDFGAGDMAGLAKAGKGGCLEVPAGPRS